VLISFEKNPDQAIEQGASYLRQGKLVAFPTETVYGLGANAWDPVAVAHIFQAKGRPADNPLIVHIAGLDMLQGLINGFSATAEKLMQTFWPGPLSLVLPKSSRVPDLVTAGLDTVAVRWPKHPVAEALVRAADLPVAAPSANRSGRPSPTLAEHVALDLGDQVDLIIDAGMVAVGLESTVVDVSGPIPVLLRPGAVTLADLQQVVGQVKIAESSGAGPAPSPGMKYRHYAPAAPLTLYIGQTQLVIAAMQQAADALVRKGARVGVLTYDEYADYFGGTQVVLSLGCYLRPEEAAQRLYGRLRQFDQHQVEVILAEGPESLEGLGLALYNRLQKAAGGRIVRV
jgi:L-threonylcarbamoyladenylate synthase